MDNLTIHPSILKKLKEKHGVSKDEVIECFSNVENGFLIDTREEHKTNPKTNWFVAETNRGLKLKIAFMYFKDKDEIVVKTAYKANQKVIDLYNTLTGKSR